MVFGSCSLGLSMHVKAGAHRAMHYYEEAVQLYAVMSAAAVLVSFC
jgi:phage baseplate assembly protein W